MKTCSRCHTPKDLNAFGKDARKKDGLTIWCRACIAEYKRTSGAAKRWYQKNLEQNRERARQYYQANAAERRDYSRNRRTDDREHVAALDRARGQSAKFAAFHAYGGPVCVCCGETEPVFLAIDHIDGCSAELRRQQGMGTNLYYWLKRNDYPPGFRVLCHNCNQGRRLNKGVCPHQVAKSLRE